MSGPGPGGFFRAADGRQAVVQPPNPAISVFFATVLLRWSPWDAHDTQLLWVGRGALIAWAADELLRGTAPFRRLLGLVVLVYEVLVVVDVL